MKDSGVMSNRRPHSTHSNCGLILFISSDAPSHGVPFDITSKYICMLSEAYPDRSPTTSAIFVIFEAFCFSAAPDAMRIISVVTGYSCILIFPVFSRWCPKMRFQNDSGGHWPSFIFGRPLAVSCKTVNVMLHRPAAVVNFGRVVILLHGY